MTPYDWQESIGNRAQYIETRLEAGVPVVAVSLDEGILVATYRLNVRKIYEVYDELLFAAIGLQSDIEAVRVAAVEFCHQEGFRRSEEDVTLQRVATVISDPIKKAFADFRTAPLVFRGLFAEVGQSPEDDKYATIDYDGDYRFHRFMAMIIGGSEAAQSLSTELADQDWTKMDRSTAEARLRTAILEAIDPNGEKSVASELAEVKFESAIFLRGTNRERRLVHLNAPGF